MTNSPHYEAYLQPKFVDVAYIRTPDIDNMAKFVLDCMDGLIYKFDSNITDCHCRKVYDSNGGCNDMITKIVGLVTDEITNLIYNYKSISVI